MAPNNNNNNNITKEDLIGLHHVNVNALLRNFLKYGQGNYNTSPNIRSKRLNDFPKLDMINKSYDDEDPVYVPKLKLPKWLTTKRNNSNKSLKRKRNNVNNSNNLNKSLKRKRNNSNNLNLNIIKRLIISNNSNNSNN